MSKMSKKALSMFRKIATRCSRDALQGVFTDAEGRLCACDGFIMVRLFADVPGDVPRVASSCATSGVLALLDKAKQEDYLFTASFPRADYHGNKPVISENLRAYHAWSRKNGHVNALYPVGDAFFDAGRLADIADLFPDAVLYTLPLKRLQPLYAKGAHGECILLPCRTSYDSACAQLHAWRDSVAASEASTAPACDPAPVPAAAPAQADPPAPAAPFVPSSIRQAVQHTPETPLKVIGYKSDGHTVCIHRVRAHHVVDNVYVYATKPNKYDRFMWQFVSLFACGYALKLDALQDCTRNETEPDANGNRTVFHYCANFADDGADYCLADYLRMHNACFADDAAFLATVENQINAGRHVSLAFVRLLAEMGGQQELIARVMTYRQQREHARQQAESAREAARLEAERLAEQQRQQARAQALASCRAVLLSDGQRMPVDGSVLCELAASVGVPVSLKLKGWIVNKLAAVTIEDGHMTMYSYNRQKKTEKGSTAFWGFMQQLLSVLHQQEEAAASAAAVCAVDAQPACVQQQPEPADASAADLSHLFASDNAPKPENQGQNLSIGDSQDDAPACPPSDALQRLAALSSGTLSTLMREKNLPDSDQYKAIEAFHQRILFVAQSLAPVTDETWMQLFERAYHIAYAPASALDDADPVQAISAPIPALAAHTQEDVQDNTQDNTQPAHHAPALQNQPTNPLCAHPDGHTLPRTYTAARQIGMQELFNTS